MRHLSRGLLLCLVFAALASTKAFAVAITFEDLTAPGPGGAGLTVNNQYAGLGVIITNATAFDYTKGGSFAIPGFPHSGNVAVEACFAGEFCQSPMQVDFTAGQAHVQVWVGLDYRASQTTVVEMQAYDGVGTVVGDTTVTLPANPNAVTFIRFPLTISRFAADIRRVDIGLAPVGTGYNTGLAVDDIEFDTIGPTPPCPAVNPPSLAIVQPTAGTTMRCNRFLFQDNVITGDPFARRTVSVRGPSMGQLTQWTTQASTGVGGQTWVYDAMFPGLNTITDRIEDCKGFVEKSTTVEYDPIPDGTSFVVDGFEVTQAVQRLPSSVPLITDKRTVVRVYLHLEGPLPSLAGIRGNLSANLPGASPAFNLGAGIPPYNVQSLNAITVTQSTDLKAARGNINASLNFEIPASWTEAGQVHFSLSGLTVDGCDTNFQVQGYDERLPLGNYYYHTFSPAPSIQVRIVDVPYQTTSGGTVFTPRDKDFNFLVSWLGRAYPTANVIATRTSLSTRTGTPGSSFSADDINSQLQDTRSMEVSNGSVSDKVHYYGMVADGGGFMRGKADDIPSHVASGPTGTSAFGWDTDGSYGDWYGGHELGHTYGRFHAEFCGAQACFTFIWTFCPGGYVPYPFNSGLLDNDYTYGNFGFDVGDPGLGLPRAVYKPDVFHDVMTYCDSEWVSDFTYNGILDRNVAENPTGDVKPRAKIADALLLSAKMNLTQETAQLRPFWRMPNLDATPLPATSHYSIHLKGVSDNDLAVYLFNPKVDSEAMAGEDFHATMSEVVPWVAGTHRIVIMRDSVEMASRTVTPNTPVVHVLSPNGGENLNGATATVTWTASDADSQPLTYALQYSKDAGATWQVVDTGLTSPTDTVNLDTIPGSATALFRVYATDGVNTGVDTSDATFIVKTKPPVVKIITPGNNDTYTSSDTVLFNGSAMDVQDGDLSGASLQWVSNIQGTLGTGKSVSASLLPGTHKITLTATDSSGATGTATVTVVVTAAIPVPVMGGDRYAIVGAPVSFDASASTGVPTLAYSWQIVSRPDGSAAAISNPTTATPSFTPDQPGAYVVQLTLTDGTGTSAVARVTVIATSAVGALRIAGGLAKSSAGDMILMNVENGGPSAAHIDIVDAVRLARRSTLGQAGGGTVSVSAANRYNTYGVFLDDQRLNGSPDRRVLACHQFVFNYNKQMAVWYDSSVQKWVAYNEDRSNLVLGEEVNFAFGPDFGTATRGASNGPFDWGVYLDDPRINYNPAAIVLSTHDYVSNYGSTLGVWYNGSKWVAFNEDGLAIPGGERYFWTDATASGGRVIRSPGTAYSTYGVYLDDARINGNQRAIVLAQHSGVSVYNPSAVGVWFDGTRWVAYNEDRTPLATGEAINYMIVQP